MNIPQTTKAALRQQARTALKELTRGERTDASSRAIALAREQIIWRTARSVLFYSALSDEMDLGPLINIALEEGKCVALPRFSESDGSYSVCQVAGRDSLRTGRYGILEPDLTAPSIPLKQLDLLFVPGLAFSQDGRRLGRGKGFYDRLLANVHGIKCGVCFDFQIQEQIPLEPHDIVLNCVLTPTRWFKCDSGAAF
jgi:5-formyltetrahydrofolate cyclo-ligase